MLLAIPILFLLSRRDSSDVTVVKIKERCHCEHEPSPASSDVESAESDIFRFEHVRLAAPPPGHARRIFSATWYEGQTVKGSHVTLMEPADLSAMNRNHTLLIYVYSAPYNQKLRQQIRLTWASGVYHRRLWLKPRVVFVLGVNVTDLSRDNLAVEQSKHGDLLQFDIQDSYYNLTLKGLCVMRWLAETLPMVRYYLKVDDDVLLNPMGWVSLLRSYHSHHLLAPCFLCCVNYQSPVLHEGKWAIQKTQTNMNKYPPFCNGPVYFYNRKALLRTLQLAQSGPLFVLEDVYFTGILATESRIPRISVCPGSLAAEMIEESGVVSRLQYYLHLLPEQYHGEDPGELWRDLVFDRTFQASNVSHIRFKYYF